MTAKIIHIADLRAARLVKQLNAELATFRATINGPNKPSARRVDEMHDGLSKTAEALEEATRLVMDNALRLSARLTVHHMKKGHKAVADRDFSQAEVSLRGMYDALDEAVRASKF